MEDQLKRKEKSWLFRGKESRGVWEEMIALRSPVCLSLLVRLHQELL